MLTISQRQVGVTLIAVQAIAGIALFLIQLATGGFPLLTMVNSGLGAILLLGLLYGYWQGWPWVKYVATIASMVLIGTGLPNLYVYDLFSAAVIVPVVVAVILTDPLMTGLIGAGMYLLVLARAGFTGIYTDPINITLYLLICVGVTLSRLVTDTAQRTAESHAARAEEALARSETQSTELSHKATELEQQNAEQRRLLDLVATLETPAVSLADGVLLAPVVGHIDSRRAQDLTGRLLHEVSAQRARLVILDIAGVPTVDTAVASALLQAVQALRLLGCEVTITGISASVAGTMTQLGISMSGVRTARTPQEAIEQTVVPLSKSPADGSRRS